MIHCQRPQCLGTTLCLLSYGILYICWFIIIFQILITVLTSGRYGGIFERGSHEYTLDDFYSIQLDKMDRFVCLKKTDIVIAEDEESSSDDGDEEDSDDGTEEDGDDDESEDEEDADDKVMSGTPLTSLSKENKETPTGPEHRSEEGAGAPDDPHLTKVATSEVCKVEDTF